jgi:hypothetical protein
MKSVGRIKPISDVRLTLTTLPWKKTIVVLETFVGR